MRTIKEKLNNLPSNVETVEIEDLGKVGVARLKTADMLALSKLPDERQGLAIVARCALEADGSPVFTSPDEVADVEWRIIKPLLNECYRVNGINRKVADAGKN